MAQSTTLKNGPTTTFIESLSSDAMLVCGICLELLHKPKLLPCVHSFCKRCVKSLIKDDCPKIQCPTCKENFGVPKNRVDGFKDSVFLSQLLGLLSLSQSIPRPCVICDVEGRDATLQCQDCTDIMCKQCSKVHRKNKANKKHKFLKLAEVKKKGTYELRDIAVQCIHHKEPVTKFCLVCDTPACIECLDDQHRFHRNADFTQAAVEKRAVLKITMSSLKQKSVQLKNLITTVENLSSRLDAHKGEQMTAIEAKRKELVDIVEEITGEHRKNLDNLLGQPLNTITSHQGDCKSALRNFQSVIEFGSRLLEHGSARDVVLAEKELVGRLKVLDAKLKDLQGTSLGSYSQKTRIVFLPGKTGELRGYIGTVKSEYPESDSDSSDDDDDDVDADIIKAALEQKSTQDTLSRNRRPKLELMMVFDDDTEEKRPNGILNSSFVVELHKSENPWIPYFQQDLTISPLTSPLVQAKQKEELCLRSVTLALNKLSPTNFSTQITYLLDAQVDSELKLEKLCSVVVSMVSGGVSLVQMLALLCRSITFLSVPTDGRPGANSTVLNFLDRFCLRRFETGSGQFLGTGKTPQVSRSSSFTFPGSKRPSFLGDSWGTRTPQATLSRTPQPSRLNTTDLFSRNRSHFGSWHGSKSAAATPVGTLSRSNSISSEAGVPPNIATDDSSNPFAGMDRRRRNLSIIYFICEMFKLRMIAENIVYEWIQRLTKVDNDLSTEAVCALLFRVGRYLDHDRSRHMMNKVLVQLTYILGRRSASGRIRAMIQDVIELREDEWITQRPYNYWAQLLGDI